MKSRLGKGLGELFGENYFVEGMMDGETSSNVLLSEIVPNPYQPRKNFNIEQLQELADSIKEHGVITPIIVVMEDGKYVLIAGERRLRASKLAGLEVIPAIIRDYTESQMMEIALLENIQREDLTPIEVAYSYKSLIDKLELTQDQLAKRVGKSRSHVTNMLGLVYLPNVVQDMVNAGHISMGHARVLSKLDDQDKILELANRIKNEKLSVRDIELLGKLESKKVEVVRKDSFDYSMYQDVLVKSLDAKVKVKKGSITIKFKDLQELETLIEKIK
jgi:ParB family chromosome partitioning protein